jgi:hypothetical protein
MLSDVQVDGVKQWEWTKRGTVKEKRARVLGERDVEDLQVVWVQQR